MRGWNLRISAADLCCAAGGGYISGLISTTGPLIAQPPSPTLPCRNGRTAPTNSALQARHLLRLDLVHQLRPDPQPRLDLGACAGRDLHAGAELAHQCLLLAAGAAGGGQRERAGVARGRDPGGEEVVLEHRDPAAGDLLVEGAVLGEILELALVELVRGAVPGGAVEAVRLGLGEAGLDHRRHPHELAVDVALPGRAALVDNLVHHLHRVLAAAEGPGAADGD